jgi:hypothetical protein
MRRRRLSFPRCEDLAWIVSGSGYRIPFDVVCSILAPPQCSNIFHPARPNRPPSSYGSNQCATRDRSITSLKNKPARICSRQKATNCRINATKRCRGRHLFHSSIVIDAHLPTPKIRTSSGSWTAESRLRSPESLETTAAPRDREYWRQYFAARQAIGNFSSPARSRYLD